jgi:hypothetical protein
MYQLIINGEKIPVKFTETITAGDDNFIVGRAVFPNKRKHDGKTYGYFKDLATDPITLVLCSFITTHDPFYIVHHFNNVTLTNPEAYQTVRGNYKRLINQS